MLGSPEAEATGIYGPKISFPFCVLPPVGSLLSPPVGTLLNH